jgi:FkbM family methyltransferase
VAPPMAVSSPAYLLSISLSNSRSLPARAVVSLLRLPSRIYPIPGWFPLVVERVHPHVSGADSPVETELDGFRMRLDLDDYTQRRIYYGCHEPRELALVRKLLRPGDTVLDVGAHVGLFTLLAAATVGPNGQVHAFEPVPANFDALAENVRLNGFSRVDLEQTAVGEAAGQMTLGLGMHVQAGSGSYMQGGSDSQVDAQVINLDDYVRERLPSTPIRLLKIDVEGAEPAVLRGFQQSLADAPPDAIIAEVSPETLALQGYTVADLLGELTKHGYDLYRLPAFGGLKSVDALKIADLGRPHPESTGAAGLIRRGLVESRTFFNVFALRPELELARS